VGGFRTRRSGGARGDGVSSSGVDAYVSRLREELRRRWLDDDRLVSEAREHLVDRIADGMRRGLTREAAEQQAIREFGLAGNHRSVQRCRKVSNG
jgi:hypothetical protein